MYTRCPKCSTVFRITAAQLRIAEGEVRCGNCTISFNALTELTDDLPELVDAVVLGTDLNRKATPEADTGSVSTSDEEEDRDPNVQEPSEPIDATLEFDAPEVSWPNFFVSPEPDKKSNNEGAEYAVESDEADRSFDSAEEPEQDISPLELETADPDEWREFLAELSGDDIRGAKFEASAESEGAEDSSDANQDGVYEEDDDPTGDQPGIVLNSWIDDDRDLAKLQADSVEPDHNAETSPEPPLVVVNSSPEFDPDDDIIDEPQIPSEASYELAAESGAAEYLDHHAHELPGLFDDETEPGEYGLGPEKKVGRWSLMTIALLGIAFLGQLLHYNRDSLAAHPKYGGIVRTIYARIGSTLYPEWTLGAFRVRGTEAVAGRSSSSALDILATIEVTGSEPVGLPLVRIALQDRWANPVASRVFYPSEYLGTDEALPEVLSNGTTLPVEVSVIDPGTAAQNYVIDVCIPSRSRGLKCQLERNPFQS